MDREALEAFRMYLARLPKAENRNEVENRVRALEEHGQRRRRCRPRRRPPASIPRTPTPPTPRRSRANAAGTPEAAADGSSPRRRLSNTADGSRCAPAGTQRLARASASSATAVGDRRADASLTTLTLVGHLALGHDVLEGLVVGGGLMFVWGLTPKVHVGDSTAATRAPRT